MNINHTRRLLCFALLIWLSATSVSATPLHHYVFFGQDREKLKQATSFLETKALEGAQIAYSWKQLEPSQDEYDFSLIREDLEFLKSKGKKLFVQLQDVTFSDSRVNVPRYLTSDPKYNGGVFRQYQIKDENEEYAAPGGWMMRRWDPAVQERFHKLLSALGKEFDGRIEGINFAETSCTVGWTGKLFPQGFSPAVYRDGIITNMKALKRAFPKSVTLQYANFMPGEWLPARDKGYLKAVYQAARELRVGVGGPDLLPFRRPQQTHPYPLIRAAAGITPNGVAVQDGNYEDINPATGKRATIPELIKFATEDLKLTYIFWCTEEPFYSSEVIPLLKTGAQQTHPSEQFTADFDFLWSALRDNYVYFDKKQTDWNKVRAVYRPLLADVKNRNEFVTFLERVLDELYDNHTSLNTNLETSPRLVPTGIDLWAEWTNGSALITEIRTGFSAEQAGIRVGMEIVSINGLPIKAAVAQRLPKSLKTVSEDARNWALRAVLAGTHDKPRIIEARNQRGVKAVYRLDLPTHTTVDRYRYIPKVESRMLPGRIGYIRINDLIETEIVAQFDSALEQVRTSRGLILDLRDIPRGGNTDVAEPILGRLIDRRMGYQQVVPLQDPRYIKEVLPRGPGTYHAPIVVLVNRWTASMAEGMAIGLDGMKRARIVGTRMAGLNGGIFNLELPNTKIGIGYAGEKLDHINGTPRESFVPTVLVNLMDSRFRRSKDPVFELGRKELLRLINRASSG